MRDELIGFTGPSDFSTFVLRAGLSKRYGFFGTIPIWGGVKLHEFYPPIATVIVRYLGMFGALILYFIFVPVLWINYKGLATAVLFMSSYFHIFPLLIVGRYAEFMGYGFLSLAIFVDNDILSGILWGLGSLSHPLPMMLGAIIFLLKLKIQTIIVAFIVCGWWYVPFFLKRKRLSYLKEMRSDKLFGLYFIQYLSMVNILIYLFAPLWLQIVTSLTWFLPFSFKPNMLPKDFGLRNILLRFKPFFEIKPFFTSDLTKHFPKLKEIKEGPIVLTQKSYNPEIDFGEQAIGSFGLWIWSCACYLLERGVIVYNGLPSTEVAVDHLNITEGLPVYSVESLR